MVFVPSGTGFPDVPLPDLTRPLDPNGGDVAPRPGMVRIAPSNPRKDLPVILINASPPDRNGGVGGWETVERPLRRPSKWWKAPPVSTMTLHCLIDATAIRQRLSVEHAIERLYSLGGDPDRTGDPTPVRLDGDVMPRDKRIDWVIQDITLGERLYQRGGALQRQALDIELEEYVAVPDIEPIKVKATRDKAGRRKRFSLRSRQGDTLRTIAVRELGSASEWSKIRRWNPKVRKVHPDDPLATGTRIVIGGTA
jgi:hypothetical protein